MTDREIELKLSAGPDALSRLQQGQAWRSIVPAPAERLRSVYYDTSRRDLWRERVTLRLRSLGARHWQTIKCGRGRLGAAFDRPEYEWEVPGEAPQLDGEAAAVLRRALRGRMPARRSLKPVFETVFTRTAGTVRLDGGGEIVIALDQGEIRGDGRSSPIAELELKAGRPAHLYALARQLHAEAPLRLLLTSKAERGVALLEAPATVPVTSAPPLIAHEMTPRQAFAAIAESCLQHFLANLPAIEARQSEGVHQARVALRRLRSAMDLFPDLTEGAEAKAVRAKVKGLAVLLGDARDLDVLREEVVWPVRRAMPEEPGLANLDEAIAERARLQYDALLRRLEAPEFTDAVLRIAGWVADQGWPPAVQAPAEADTGAALGRHAEAMLKRRWRKVKRLAERLEALDTAQRHRLRIRVKRLRYAGEFFAPLFDEAAARKRLRRLRKLQNALGVLNDLATAKRQFAALGAASGGDLAHAAGLVEGWHAHLAEAREGQAATLWRKLKHHGPFW